MILLTVDEDPAVIEHTLGILKKVGGSHQVHTASNLAVAENSARELEALDVLIVPAIASTGESFFALRDSLRARFEKLHVLFLNDYDISEYQNQLGNDPVLPRRPDDAALTSWAASIGFGTLPSTTGSVAISDPETEPLLVGSPEQPSSREIPIAVESPASAQDGDNAGDEELPVAGLVAPPAD